MVVAAATFPRFWFGQIALLSPSNPFDWLFQLEELASQKRAPTSSGGDVTTCTVRQLHICMPTGDGIGTLALVHV